MHWMKQGREYHSGGFVIWRIYVGWLVRSPLTYGQEGFEKDICFRTLAAAKNYAQQVFAKNAQQVFAKK